MKSRMKKNDAPMKKGPSIFSILKPYRSIVALLVIIAVAINGLNLVVPKVISHSIDDFIHGKFNATTTSAFFIALMVVLFALNYLLSIIQTIASERVGRDLRQTLTERISRQSYKGIQEFTPAKLLTNLTSDIDAVKLFVAQAISSGVASIVTIIGASALLLSINWKLALAVLTILPIIAGTFFFVLGKVRKLFMETRTVIDWLNKVINESILGSSLIRILNSQAYEYQKFLEASTKAKAIGLNILKMFASMIPIITFVANMATVIILGLGGHFVINGSMTLGDFAAFNSYIGVLIFPIFVIGFLSNIIAQANAAYGRVVAVLEAKDQPETGTITAPLRGEITFDNISLTYAKKPILKHISVSMPAGTKTAIIGPTAAGKTQLLYLLTGLVEPTEGTILYDGKPISEYEKVALHRQIGFVFQDSILFNLSIRQNIAFGDQVTHADVEKAIKAAEIADFVSTLPDGLDTIVSERGTTLSGGQKQRIMLARALALNPRILLLDDFTARVDNRTEKKIVQNIMEQYPNITLVTVTQKIASVENYDQIVLLMEGEILGKGTHQELMKTSTEYVQIFESQQSTHAYE